MDWKTCYSLTRLIEEGRRLAPSCRTVSFDLFDTLLIRRIHNPDLVKRPVARFISSLAEREGISQSSQAVQRLRDTIEQRQRAETGAKYADHEACYPVFMAELLETIFGSRYDEDLLARVTAYELEMESAMLVVRADLAGWAAELKEQGKQLFVISDVYLPADHLKRLLDRAGLLPLFEDVISSADSFRAKASGEAFELVRERFDLDVDSWLHVGDNPVSDGLRPARSGLEALVLRDGEEKYRKSLLRRYHLYGMGRPFYRGRALQQLMLPLEAENVERPDLYVEGFNFFAPLIGTFVQHVAEESRRLGLSRVFFFSREGHTFKKVWETITPLLFPDGDLPECEYLYVSRMALAGPACAAAGLTRKTAAIALLPPGNKDFNDIARIFGLDIEPLRPHLQNHNLSADTCLSSLHPGYDQKHTTRFHELLEDQVFQDEVRRQVAPAALALHRYLEAAGFFAHDQVAVVDIGWLGTIQRFLYEAVRHRPDCPRMHGFVFAATRGIPFVEDLKNSLRGVIYDRHRFDLAASTILYARDVFEEACRAPHPTIDAYVPDGDGYRLQFRTTDDDTGRAEQIQDEYFRPVQEGIVAGAEKYAAASALLGYSLEDYRPWLHCLLATKLAFPRTAEVVALRHRYHLDDFHGVNRPLKRKIKGTRQLWDYRPLALRLLPLLRLRLLWRHIRTVLQS